MRKLSHGQQAKSRKGHEKLLKMFKTLETRQMAKNKTLLSLQVMPSSSQICKEVQKPRFGRDDYLFWKNVQYIYIFQLP